MLTFFLQSRHLNTKQKHRENLETVLEISNMRTMAAQRRLACQLRDREKVFTPPLKQDGVILIQAGQCHTCFSKFVPLRQLFDNRYTVGREISTLRQLEYQIGTDISTLYQTEHQIVAAALKTRLAFVNAEDRDIIKVLKSVLGFPLDRSKGQAK